MFEKRFYYLIKFQYLGFRYHGWQKQPDVITVQRMIERTLAYVLEHKNFKILASGRTDAKVSVQQSYFELFLKDEDIDGDLFLDTFNANLPQDIRALSIKKVDKAFNIMDAPVEKEYLYIFAHGSKNHPFAAPFMVTIPEQLNIKAIQKAVQLFEGTHDFKSYTYKPKIGTQTIGTIKKAEVVVNDLYTASFFPTESFIFRVVGKGFKRHQVRLMMGALIDIGLKSIDQDFIRRTLDPEKYSIKLERIAPSSGLILQRVILDKDYE